MIGSTIRVHRVVGPGLLESVYEECLAHQLGRDGFSVERQVVFPLVYGDLRIACGYRADLVVERRLIVELKSVERFLPVHDAQLLTYLRLSGCRIGLMLNFNVARLKDRLRRIVL